MPVVRLRVSMETLSVALERLSVPMERLRLPVERLRMAMEKLKVPVVRQKVLGNDNHRVHGTRYNCSSKNCSTLNNKVTYFKIMIRVYENFGD